MPPVSVTYWNISGYVIFWILFAVAFGLFTQRVYLLFRLLRLGQKEEHFDSIGRRIISVLVEVFPQWCNLKNVTRRDLAGIGHFLMFWGFSLFFIGYIIFIGLSGGLGLSPVLAGSAFETVYSSILDIAGVFVAAVLVWAAIRRYIVKPERLEASAEAGVILLLVFSLMVLHFCVEGFGYAAYKVQASWPPIGTAFASFLTGIGISESTLVAAYRGFWWLHYAIILGFMVYIPYSKHLHILASPFNVFFKSLDTKGDFRLIELEKAEPFGVSKVQDFTWKHLLDLYSCAECGRCHAICPAALSGELLDPKKVILNLKEHLLEVGPELLKVRGKAEASSANHDTAMIGQVVTEEEIWECTTCRACQEVCPVGIEQMVKIIDMRRHLVFESKLDRGHERALHRTLDEYNPWGLDWGTRDQWATGLDVEEAQEGKQYDFLYWVGCAACFDDRVRKVARSLVMVFKQAGLKVAILGNREMCCGDFARRIGDEGLFQSLALANIKAIESVQAKAVVTHCPHCFHVMKDEYPQLGARFQTLHHTQVLARLLRQGKLTMRRGGNLRIVYHDPCYLGRYHHIFEEPRILLRNMAGAEVVEMERNQRKSFCCGGGGGRVWEEERGGAEHISSQRVQEALQTGAQTIVTACPFCLTILEDTPQVRVGSDIEVKDIVEVVDIAFR